MCISIQEFLDAPDTDVLLRVDHQRPGKLKWKNHSVQIRDGGGVGKSELRKNREVMARFVEALKREFGDQLVDRYTLGQKEGFLRGRVLLTGCLKADVIEHLNELRPISQPRPKPRIEKENFQNSKIIVRILREIPQWIEQTARELNVPSPKGDTGIPELHRKVEDALQIQSRKPPYLLTRELAIGICRELVREHVISRHNKTFVTENLAALLSDTGRNLTELDLTRITGIRPDVESWVVSRFLDKPMRHDEVSEVIRQELECLLGQQKERLEWANRISDIPESDRKILKQWILEKNTLYDPDQTVSVYRLAVEISRFLMEMNREPPPERAGVMSLLCGLSRSHSREVENLSGFIRQYQLKTGFVDTGHVIELSIGLGVRLAGIGPDPAGRIYRLLTGKSMERLVNTLNQLGLRWDVPERWRTEQAWNLFILFCEIAFHVGRMSGKRDMDMAIELGRLGQSLHQGTEIPEDLRRILRTMEWFAKPYRKSWGAARLVRSEAGYQDLLSFCRERGRENGVFFLRSVADLYQLSPDRKFQSMKTIIDRFLNHSSPKRVISEEEVDVFDRIRERIRCRQWDDGLLEEVVQVVENRMNESVMKEFFSSISARGWEFWEEENR